MKNAFRNVKKDNSKRKGDIKRQQDRRRDEAVERQKVYDGLMIEQKLLWVSERPGESKKEKSRLLAKQGAK